LWALGLEEARWIPTTPGNAAHRRDYYAVDVPEAPPDIIEAKVLAPIEGEARRILDAISASHRFPSDDGYDLL
jgi:hypothetical protein